MAVAMTAVVDNNNSSRRVHSNMTQSLVHNRHRNKYSIPVLALSMRYVLDIMARLWPMVRPDPAKLIPFLEQRESKCVDTISANLLCISVRTFDKVSFTFFCHCSSHDL